MYLLMFIKPMTKLPPLVRHCLSDIDLQGTYRAIDGAATGRIPFSFCAESIDFVAKPEAH